MINEKKQLKFYIWLSAAFMAVTFIALINLNRTYKAETDVLIIPRNDAVSKNISQISNSVKEIPKTLSFYDRLLISNEELDDEAKELPDYKRKAYWESKIRTEQIDDSSMIKITVFDKSQTRSEDLSRQAGLEIAGVMSQYYNIRTELELRITDGPIISYGLEKSLWALILESILGGILAAFMVYITNNFLEMLGIGTKSQGKKLSAAIRKLPGKIIKPGEEPIMFDKKPSGLEKRTRLHPEKESFFLTGKRAAAPENLPIAEGPVISGANIEPAKAEKMEKSEISEKPVIREATPEEVKERLNKLLRGEF